MRKIKKAMKVQEIEAVIYDREKKEERVEKYTVAEVQKEPTVPENCVVLEKKVLSEKEVTYSMSPEVFVAHATIEEK